MSKNTFQLHLNNIDYSAHINYPISITDKRLEDSFNTYTVTLNRLDDADPFIPHQKVQLKWLVDEIEIQSFPSLLLADAVEKIGVLDKYKHNFNLVEYTYYLDLVALPDIAITRIEGSYEPTLRNVISRILTAAGHDMGPFGLGISLDSNTYSILDSIKSPEWTFTRMTAYEAVRMVFAYAKIVPRMVDFVTLGHSEVFSTEETSQKIGRFFTKTQSYNPQTYRTRLLSNVDNFIAGDEDGSITEPANGWLTPRSADGYAISNDNALIPTSRPIYKVEKLQLARHIAIGRYQPFGSIKSWVTIPYDLIPESWWIKPADGSTFLYEEGVWNTLSNIEVYGQRGGSFYYKQGEPNILNLGYRSPTKWSWNPTDQSWKVVVNHFVTNVQKFTLADWIKPEFLSQADTIAKNYWTSTYGDSQEGVYYLPTLSDNSLSGENPDPRTVAVYNLKFRITYTPYTQTNLFTYRERKDNNQELLTTQYYNQQANVISSVVLGELHDRVSKSNSGSEQNLIYLHGNYNEILSSGYRFEDYVITTASHNVGLTSIHSTYNFDKYFVKLNSYVAVLEKWRQFSIPNEGIVRRQYTFNRFARFSYIKSAPPAGGMGLKYSEYLNSNNEVRMLRMSPTQGTDVVAPTTNFAFNNALIWEATLQGNASAGDRSIELNSTQRRNEPIRYTEVDGRLVDTPSITMFHEFPVEMNTEASQNLPIAPITFTQDAWFNLQPGIEKDAREILSFSLQLHHIDETGDTYINKGLARENGLVGGAGLVNDSIFFILLKSRPYNQTFVPFTEVLVMTITPNLTLEDSSIKLPRLTNNTGQIAYASALVKNMGTNYEVLYWTKEVVNPSQISKQLYINFNNQY